MLQLFRLFILISLIVVGGYYAQERGWIDLSNSPIEPISTKVLGAVDPVIKSTTFQSTLNTVEEEGKKTLKTVWDKTKTMTIPTKIEGMPEEIVVEDAVNQLVNEVKNLPETQLKKVKTQFCQDVIISSTASGVTN